MYLSTSSSACPMDLRFAMVVEGQRRLPQSFCLRRCLHGCDRGIDGAGVGGPEWIELGQLILCEDRAELLFEEAKVLGIAAVLVPESPYFVLALQEFRSYSLCFAFLLWSRSQQSSKLRALLANRLPLLGQ